MLEARSNRDCLESALALKERLATVTTQSDIIHASNDALFEIEKADEYEALERLNGLDNSIREFHDAVRMVFEKRVIPKHYAQWLEGARKECEWELWELAGILTFLQATTLNTEDEYMQMLADIHGARKGHAEYRLTPLSRPRDETDNLPLPIPQENFEPWRQQEMENITKKMTDLRLQLEKIEEHEPNTSTSAP